MSDQPETKHEKFLRISGPRVEKAVYHIGLLENLGANAYENTDADATGIITALVEALDTVAVALKGPRPVLPAADETALSEDDHAVEQDDDDVEADPDEAPRATPAPAASAFAGAVVPKDFPNEAEGMELIRVGPMIGAAMEDLLAHDPEGALKKLTALMAA